MHVCLCMSPLGETFRERLRQFPSLVNCSTIDWFTEWPAEALESVGLSALVEANQVIPENRPGVVKMFKQIHQDVERKSKEFYDVLRRYNYVTPTSYLELLSSFDTLLAYKRGEVATKKNRLKIGLDKIISTGELVEGMQKELEILAPQLVVKGKEVDEMMVLTQRPFPNFKLRRWRLHETAPPRWRLHDHTRVDASRECTETVSRRRPCHTGRHRPGQEGRGGR